MRAHCKAFPLLSRCPIDQWLTLGTHPTRSGQTWQGKHWAQQVFPQLVPTVHGREDPMAMQGFGFFFLWWNENCFYSFGGAEKGEKLDVLLVGCELKSCTSKITKNVLSSFKSLYGSLDCLGRYTWKKSGQERRNMNVETPRKLPKTSKHSKNKTQGKQEANTWQKQNKNMQPQPVILKQKTLPISTCSPFLPYSWFFSKWVYLQYFFPFTI